MLSLSFWNVLLRSLTLGSKFAFTFFLAKFFSPEEVGLFGIFNATVPLVVHLIGLDFYAYSNRELIPASSFERSKRIRDQLIFHLLVFTLCLPFFYFLLRSGTFPPQLIGWLILISFLDHLAQELFRILTALSKPIWATLTYFVRSGLWAILLLIVFFVLPGKPNFSLIWPLWALTTFLSLGGALLINVHPSHKSILAPIDWKWIFDGLRTCLPLFIASLSVRAAYTMDRYFLEHYFGYGALASYSLFSVFANVVMVITETGALMITYPRMVKAFHSQKKNEILASTRNLTKLVLLASLGSAAILTVMIFPILKALNNPLYTNDLMLFWGFLAAMVIQALTQIPQTILYAQRKDKEVLFASLATFVMALILNFFLVAEHGAKGAILATISASLVGLFSRLYFTFHRSPPLVPKDRSYRSQDDDEI